jgi:hypothetical protein
MKKKLLLSVAAIALLATTIVSCTSEKKDGATSDTNEVTAVDSPAVSAETATTTADVPSFSNEEVNKGLAEFATLRDEYLAALKSKDAAKIQELGTKYSTWAQGAATWATKLKADEMQKYSDYMTKISKEWTDAAMTAAQ